MVTKAPFEVSETIKGWRSLVSGVYHSPPADEPGRVDKCDSLVCDNLRSLVRFSRSL